MSAVFDLEWRARTCSLNAPTESDVVKYHGFLHMDNKAHMPDDCASLASLFTDVLSTTRQTQVFSMRPWLQGWHCACVQQRRAGGRRARAAAVAGPLLRDAHQRGQRIICGGSGSVQPAPAPVAALAV